jgi:nucleoside-diphosphate-sugar epimerase
MEGLVTMSQPAKILVTGNMGYVGPSVVARLRASYPNATLLGLDAGLFAHCLTGCAELPERRLDAQHFGDVRTVEPALLHGVDAVVHLAAVSNDPIGNVYDEVTIDVNSGASIRLAELAKAAGAGSFVFASSCSVYGVSGDDVATEESATNPLTPYARSKILTEEGLVELADESFTVTCLRFATACGMSDRVRLDLVLNDFVASALATQTITILSDGTPWRPLVHVHDMARAIDWAIQRDGSAGSPYLSINAGSDEWNYRINDLAEAVADVIPGVDISLASTSGPDKRSYRVSFERFRELAPAHQPEVSLRSAVEDLRDGLGRMGFSDPDFRSSSLMRLVVLQGLRAQGLLDDQLKWTRSAGMAPFAGALADGR